MDDVLLRSTLRAQGYSDGELAALVAAGGLLRLRRGTYARPDGIERSVEEEHRRLLHATLPHLAQDGTVVSHGSAAVLHGLPVWSGAVSRVHITRPRQGGGRTRPTVERHTSPLRRDEITAVDGWDVTTAARTVVDLARTRPLEQGVAAADKALALGLEEVELLAALGRAHGWPGIGVARRALLLADARAESAGESVSRVRLAELGLAEPELQHEVTGPDGFTARLDFAWPQLGVLGEFDGRVKYGRLLRAGQDPGEVVFAEKLREDMLRDLGWQVVRWIWADLDNFGPVAERLRRAFARAAA